MTFRILMNPCLFLSLNVLAACAALNVGSFEKLSGVDPLTSDPAELRVALLVPEALSLRRGDATLGISWKADGAPLDTHRFALQIQSGNVGAPGLTEGMREGQTLYVLTLTPADAERLRDMQEKIAATKGTEARVAEALRSVFPVAAGAVRFLLTRKSRSMPGSVRVPTKTTSSSFRDWI